MLICECSSMDKPRITVVYADDDDLVRNAIGELLLFEGLDVHACANGAEAIHLCGLMDPDVVLLDLNMPGVDGLEVARKLRSHLDGKRLWLVALTGKGTAELHKEAMDAGFDEFLTKPVPTHILINTLCRREHR
jgi:CheY-like chemotaxis protein